MVGIYWCSLRIATCLGYSDFFDLLLRFWWVGLFGWVLRGLAGCVLLLAVEVSLYLVWFFWFNVSLFTYLNMFVSILCLCVLLC